MDLRLSEDQSMFKRMFADFCTKEIRPRGEQIDQTEEIPIELLNKAVDQGFWAALVPEAMDGCGLDVYTYALMLEELGRADMSTAVTLAMHNSLVVKPLLDHGTGEQRDRFVAGLAMGELLGAFALTEPGAGSDAASLRTAAVRDGDSYRLTGSKVWVGNGGLAGLFLVFARSAGGITAFLVERGTRGLTVGYREKTLGLRGVSFNTLYFDDACVPADQRLGEEGKGLDIAQQALNYSRLGLGAIALGACERSLEEAVRFSMDHIQFSVPIAQKQIIQNYVANAKVSIEAMRGLVTHTAWLADTGQDFSQHASITKLFAGHTAFEVTNKLLQVHGGYGYMKEYAIERYYRDCRALEIIAGTSQIQQYLIARDIYRAEGLEIRP
jgi:alkylation response protein AidB-like acyl-CoA dehydrogenase